MCSLRSTNCSGVIAPARSAWSPYWTPVLSNGSLAKPNPADRSAADHALRGRRPNTFTEKSWNVLRHPAGFVTGS
jgi:hypothetical protein